MTATTAIPIAANTGLIGWFMVIEKDSKTCVDGVFFQEKDNSRTLKLLGLDDPALWEKGVNGEDL
jgi:hypothetical protein